MCRSQYLASIFKISSGVVPSSWKLATLLPFLTSGDRYTFSNYKPIYFSATYSCKMLKHITHNLMCSVQHALQHCYSTVTQVTQFMPVSYHLDCGHQINSFLSIRLQCASFHSVNCCSTAKLSSCYLQGSVGDLLLFLVYINDLPNNIAS